MLRHVLTLTSRWYLHRPGKKLHMQAKMNLIEVDPILFVKCRLCLGETGQYQIVPNIQMQIKYCFEIDVETFDGLPQLVCKNCKSILSQYTGVKQIFQEKQKILKSKLSTNSSNVINDNIIQQQQNSTSSAQGDIENKNKPQRIKKYKRKTKVPTEYSATKTTFKTTRTKASKTAWESSYTKYFVCRFCTKTFKDKNAFNNHIQKQCILYAKYSNINKTFCLVELNKIGTTSNIIGSTNRVACNKYNILESRKATYYILYKSKKEEEESNVHHDLSDSNGSSLVDNNIHKRQCLITRTSNKSQNNAENLDYKKVIQIKKHEKDNTNVDKMTRIVSDIECVNKEGFDSKSTKCSVKMEDIASEKLVPENNTIHDKIINNIIAIRSHKYMNSLNLFVGQNAKTCKEESSLKHNNMVNIENKVIYSKEFNTTEFLRYVEQENLDVVWLPKINGKVQVNTKSKENKNSCNIVWENITSLPNLQYVIEDFDLVFERISELEAGVNKTSEDKQLIQADLHKPSLPSLKYETEDFALVFERLSELEACINKNNDGEQSIQVIPQRQEKVTEREQEESMITHLANSKKDEMLTLNKSFNNDTVPSKVPIYVDKSGCKVIDNSTYLSNLLNTDRQGTKILNANPVANPKKLPKKIFCEQFIYSNELKNDSEVIEQSNEKSNHMLYMPFQISTGSLTPFNKDQVEVDRSNKVANETNRDNINAQSTLPKIHCKPISELMSVMTSSEQNNSFGLAINNERQGQINSMMQTNDSNTVYLNNPQFTNLFPLPPSPRHQNFIYYYPQRQNQNLIVNNSNLNTHVQGSQNSEHFELHYFDI